VEGTQPAVPRTEDEQRSAGAAERVAPVAADGPARRRRAAILGGGALIAVSPVAVAGGLFLPGFAALGLGALLLLLPPRVELEHGPRPRLRVIRTSAAAGRRGMVWLARGTAHVGARTFRAVEHFAASKGRDGAGRVGREAVGGAVTVGRAATAAVSRGSSWVQAVAPRVLGGLVAAARSLAREARSAAVFARVRIGPMLRRACTAGLAGSARAGHEIAALARSVSEPLSALVDARSGPRELRAPLPPPPRRARGSAKPVKRTPAPHPGSRPRSGSRRPPPSSR
jgi:hypothetical protein